MAARKKAKKAKTSKKIVKRAKARKAPAGKTKRKKAVKKAAARRPAKKKAAAPVKAAKKTSPKKKQIAGEGDYEASRAFLKDQADFVKENKARIPEMGRRARAALEGSEGPALMAAEAEARGHSKNQPEEGEARP